MTCRKSDGLVVPVKPGTLRRTCIAGGIAWDSVEGRRRRQLPQNCLPHVIKSERETFALHRE